MIIDSFVGVIIGLLNSVVQLIPAWTLPTSITDGSWISGFATFTAFMNNYFPVNDLGICIFILLSVRGALFVWDIAVWVYNHIPLKAT